MKNQNFNPLYLLLLILPVALGCYWLINDDKNRKLAQSTVVVQTTNVPDNQINENDKYAGSIKSFDLILVKSYNPIVNWPYRDPELIRQEILQISKTIIDFDPSKISKTSERMEADYQYESLCKRFYALLIEMLRFQYIDGSLASYNVKSKADYFADVFFDYRGKIKTFTVHVLAKSVYKEFIENR